MFAPSTPYHRVIKFGPGGMKCPCCNNHHAGQSQKNTKKVTARRFRRTEQKDIES